MSKIEIPVRLSTQVFTELTLATMATQEKFNNVSTEICLK